MGRRRRDGAREAYSFDLEPDDGDEPVDRGPEPAPSAGPGPTRPGPRPGPASSEPSSAAATSEPPGLWRAAGTPVVIDLDAALDESFDTSEPLGEPAPAGWASSGLLGRLRAQPRGRVLAAAAIVGVLAVGATVLKVVVDRNQDTGLRSAPGGVFDLATGPDETWTLEGSERRGTGLVATMGRLVVVQDYQGLAAVDSQTGRQRWRVGGDVGRANCGPSPDYLGTGIRPYSTDLIVCVYEERDSDASVVAVIDAEGSVVSRRTVDESEATLFPGVDGGLLSATWVGDVDEPEGGQVLIDPQTGTLADGQMIADGYDLRVRLEDAATGALRWEQTVEFETVADPYLCIRWEGTLDEEAQIDLRGGLSMGASPRMIWVMGCGIDAAFTPSGTRLDTPAHSDQTQRVPEFDSESVLPLVDGGYLVRMHSRTNGTAGSADKLLRPDGSFVREVEGDVLDPWATNGAGRGLHVLRVGDQTVAIDRDGEELWRTDVESIALLVRTRDVIVVADEALVLVGLDPTTGDQQWRSAEPLGGENLLYNSAEGTVQSVFTDGRIAAFVLPQWESANRHWVAFDLESGDQLWEQEYDGTGWGAEFAVDGRIVRWSPTGLSGLG